LLKGLQIFPKGRTFKANVSTTSADGTVEKAEVGATEKWVDGKYIVTEINVNEHMTVTMVVTWDAKADVYYKYVAIPNGPMIKAVGARVGDTRALAWTYYDLPPDDKMQIIATEVHTDDKSTWREVHVVDGKVERVQVGEATVVKR
jgi:hypothetical protein